MHIKPITKYYFINKFETNNINRLDKQTAVIYRNYNSEKPDNEFILKIKKYCQNRKIKFYLSNNVKLAMDLNLDGAYIPAFNKSTKHLAFSLRKNFHIIGSAHNIKEIKIKEIQGVNKIFISSLFKRNNNYLGINKFKNFSRLTSKKVVALGGITKVNIKKLRLLNNFEFAGISYFE